MIFAFVDVQSRKIAWAIISKNVAKGTADPGVHYFDRFCIFCIHPIFNKVREDINEKKLFFRALPESPNPIPPDPNSGNLVLFFGRPNSRFKSHLGGGERDLLKPKKQLKVQYIGIFEEIDSFY